MHRTFNAALVSAFLNHPAIRPTVDAEQVGYLDAAPLVAHPDNIFITSAHGLYMFMGQEPGVFNGHVAVLPDHRGDTAVREGKAALGTLFGTYEARTCRARVHLRLRGARKYGRLIGFRSLGTDDRFEHFIMEAGDVAL